MSMLFMLSAHGSQKGVSGPLELELYIVGCVVSDVHVGIKFSSFGRAASAIYLQST